MGTTTVMHIVKKGNTQSVGLVREALAIHTALREHRMRTTWRYLASEGDPAGGIARGRHDTAKDIATGRNLRRVGGGRRVKNAFSTSVSQVGIKCEVYWEYLDWV
ncbi:hypothetical protein DQ04_04881010 [Trypanosoma grayi]|uniref:hypothetical protein n=1 Tax=Trypanosoma grayi TaxID=71804 RepID=UPI0004F42B32|nr:hypothetical protein DQ04_04881010 [Trypanosoma grayi]KEG09644.1 hypothetical protein DQ04_04881010 [Trypanosoma grayi]